MPPVWVRTLVTSRARASADLVFDKAGENGAVLNARQVAQGRLV
jgi:hypothetical protein